MTAGGADQERPDVDLTRTVARLEEQLDASLRYGRRLNRTLYREMRADLRTANRRADRAEAELAALRASVTFRVGRAVVAVPARVRSRLRRGADS